MYYQHNHSCEHPEIRSGGWSVSRRVLLTVQKPANVKDNSGQAEKLQTPQLANTTTGKG